MAIYSIASAEPETHSIVLSRLLPKKIPHGGGENPISDSDEFDLYGVSGSSAREGWKWLQALLSIPISLGNDQKFEEKPCVEWLAAFPPLAQFANVEAVCKSFDSTVILIASVPLVIWNLLPKHWACSFIVLATSVNILDRTESLTSQTERDS